MEEWKASVKYGDLFGTSAADGHNSALFEFENYLNKKGVDVEKYKPFGIEIYAIEGHFSFRFICEDTSSQDKRMVSLGFEKQQDLSDLFVVLKRLNVMLLPKNFAPEEYDWAGFDHTITFDDRG